MAFSQLEAARTRKLVGAYIEARRPAAHIRPKLDLGFHVKGQFERSRVASSVGQEGVDDWDKASSIDADATARRSTSSLGQQR